MRVSLNEAVHTFMREVAAGDLDTLSTAGQRLRDAVAVERAAVEVYLASVDRIGVEAIVASEVPDSDPGDLRAVVRAASAILAANDLAERAEALDR